MGAIEFIAGLGKYPRLSRPTAQMSAVEKSLLLVGADAHARVLINAKLPKPPWAVDARWHGQVLASQRSLYETLNDKADELIAAIKMGGNVQLNIGALEYYDALWSAYLGASYAVAPLAQALGRGETGLDTEFEERLGVLQAVADQLKSDMPLLKKGAFGPLSTGIDVMWKSVCSAPQNKGSAECVSRGLGVEPVSIAVGVTIVLGIALIVGISYCVIKFYELKKFNERWLARCTGQQLDAATMQWCNQTGGPPPAFDPNAMVKTIAIVAGIGLGAYAFITFLPQIVGRVAAARKVGKEAG